MNAKTIDDILLAEELYFKLWPQNYCAVKDAGKAGSISPYSDEVLDTIKKFDFQSIINKYNVKMEISKDMISFQKEVKQYVDRLGQPIDEKTRSETRDKIKTIIGYAHDYLGQVIRCERRRVSGGSVKKKPTKKKSLGKKKSRGKKKPVKK